MKKVIQYFTLFERILLISSFILIILFYFAFSQDSLLTLIASLVGCAALILNAKGNPLGQALCILFSLLYAIISFRFRYYGEMITYLGMSMPMAALSLISWLKNPYKGKKSQVEVNRIKKKEVLLLSAMTLIVTVAFYFILEAFSTANLIPSTFSVTTSFAAAYLTIRRSPYFALLYASNDVVLLILWSLASLTDPSYLSVIICFLVFLAADLYSFFNWKRMQRNQKL